jgi:ABC-2 type transport system permease protein
MSALMSLRSKMNEGILSLLPEVFIRGITLLALINLWKAAMQSASDLEIGISQMLSYTYASAILSDMLVVKTQASGWLSEGVLLRLYTRPLALLSQLVAETIGGWAASLALFSLPMALAAPLFGISLKPASPFFFVSLILCVSLGFAVDALFSCLSIKLGHMNWLVGRIRQAIAALLSGSVVPIKMLPFGMGEYMRFQPFASLGGATLSIFVASSDTAQTIMLQIAWNLIIWPIALLALKKSQEGIVSYGG